MHVRSQPKLYTVHHKRDIHLEPFKALFTPIHAGAALSTEDLGILRDDSGDNISAKNRNYCELTAIYWIWKNTTDDYVGLMHYRRIFVRPSRRQKLADLREFLRFTLRIAKSALGLRDKRIIFRRQRRMTSPTTFSELGRDLVDYFRENPPRFGAALPPPEWVHGKSQRELHSIDHFPEDFDLFFETLVRLYPDMKPFLRQLDVSVDLRMRNMFIFRRDIFDIYCERLFATLFEMENKVDLSGYSEAQARIYGYLSEYYMSVFVSFMKARDGLDLLDLPIMNYIGVQTGRPTPRPVPRTQAV